MRRTFPLVIAFIMGFVMMIQYFIPHPMSQKFYKIMVQQWLIIISIFFYVFAWRSFGIYHINKIKRRKEGWWASVVAFVGVFLMLLSGFGDRIPGAFGYFIYKYFNFDDLYNYMFAPLQATMFSLLAFFIASAAFRAFKARTMEATLLLVTATIVMLGRVPLGASLWKGLPKVVEWILMYPNMAAQRGIMIGVGLGSIATSLKIILGIERSYLGGE